MGVMLTAITATHVSLSYFVGMVTTQMRLACILRSLILSSVVPLYTALVIRIQMRAQTYVPQDIIVQLLQKLSFALKDISAQEDRFHHTIVQYLQPVLKGANFLNLSLWC